MRCLFKILLLITVLIPAGISGQTTEFSSPYPVYSQYLMNSLIINPGYAGTRDALSTTLSFRRKQLNFEGSPQMQTFTAHAPLKKERVGLGLIVNYETFGVTRNTSIFAIYAYHVKFEKAKLSFGLQAGAVMSDTDYTGVSLLDPADPAFTNSISSYTLPNVGFGVYYYSRKFYAGVAVPAFFSYREKSAREGYEFYHDFNNYDFLISGGALIGISESIKIKPSVLVRYYLDNPTLIDMNANVIISDLIWLGASWRTGEDVLVGIFEVQISQQLKLGYAYEYSMSDISDFIGGTHELVLRLEFGKKVSASNPRYF